MGGWRSAWVATDLSLSSVQYQRAPGRREEPLLPGPIFFIDPGNFEACLKTTQMSGATRHWDVAAVTIVDTRRAGKGKDWSVSYQVWLRGCNKDIIIDKLQQRPSFAVGNTNPECCTEVYDHIFPCLFYRSGNGSVPISSGVGRQRGIKQTSPLKKEDLITLNFKTQEKFICTYECPAHPVKPGSVV